MGGRCSRHDVEIEEDRFLVNKTVELLKQIDCALRSRCSHPPTQLSHRGRLLELHDPPPSAARLFPA